MKLTELMFNVRPKNIYDGIRVEERAISGDPFDSPFLIIQMLFETFEKTPYVVTGRVVDQDLIDKSIKVWLSTIDSTQNGPSYNSSAAI